MPSTIGRNPVAPRFPSAFRAQVNGREFKTLSEFMKFEKDRPSLSLEPGSSFAVYVPFSDNARITGFNKNSPFTAKVLRGKAAPVRTPGQWVQITARRNAKFGSADTLKFVENAVVPFPGYKPKTLAAFKLSVRPQMTINPVPR